MVGRNRSLNHRQIATLLAFVRIYESVARDDAVDLLHQLVGTKLLRAEHTGERERLRTLDDLDASALRLRETCLIVLDRSYTDSELRAAIFTRISREQLEKDVATIGALSREDHGNYYEHLCNHYGQVRRFLPRLLREIHFEGNRAGQSVLEALEFLKRFEDSPQVTIQDALGRLCPGRGLSQDGNRSSFGTHPESATGRPSVYSGARHRGIRPDPQDPASAQLYRRPQLPEAHSQPTESR